MSKELVIGSNRHETKVAILEDDQLVEIYFQRANEYSLAGSIHKGRVTRVLPGMQSAFVDLGLERDTFLYVSDFFEENPDIDTVDEKPSRDNRRDDNRRDDSRRDRPQARPVERVSPVQIAPEPLAFEEPYEEVQEDIDDSAVFPDDAISAAVLTQMPPIAAAAVPLASPVPDEARQGQRPPEGDRNLRGDRRGRRSRRRRSRGGGFPDNKYAQPGDASATPRVQSPGVQHDTPDEPEVFETEEQEIIILPGESLAKYRSPAVSQTAGIPEPEQLSQRESEWAQEVAPEAPQVEPHDLTFSSPAPSEQAEIAAEAHSLELADRVFAHHPEETPIAEHQPASVNEATVTYGERPSAFLVSSEEARAIADSELDEPSHREPAHTESGAAEPVGSQPVETVFHPALVEEPAADPFGDEDNLERRSPLPFADEEELDEEELREAPDFDEPSLVENSLDAASPEMGAAAPPAEAASQTAVVRDPGDRYPHRVSRRMRRRRGGNRFGGQANTPQGSASEAPAENHIVAAGPANGAAAALDAEPRIATPVRAAETSAKEPRFEGRSQDKSGERSDREERPMPSISELLRPGQEIIVQIAKEPLGQKGARITSHIALPGRYVVFMPSVAHLGVSRKIASDEERLRLKRILQTHRVGTTGGFIVRTAGEGVPEDEIAADMDFLYKSWLDIRQKAEKKPAPMLLHCDLDIVQRILRDQVTEEFKSIWVDSEDMYEGILSFLQRFQPALVNRVKMYTRQAPIFDAFGITQELEKALRPKVWLKSGGYIVINQTEALVAIDINTGKYVGKSNRLEDTIVKTNTEAVKEIVRQIRLRDLGGIIVVDFIDMDERKNRQKVMQALEEAMRADRAPSKILQFNDFGLVAITRKRVKQSLERTLCSPCPYCEGAGYVKSVQTVIGEILIEAQKIARAIEGKDVLLRVHPEVAKVLKGNDNKFLEELEEILGRPVMVKSDPALHLEKFDLG